MLIHFLHFSGQCYTSKRRQSLQYLQFTHITTTTTSNPVPPQSIIEYPKARCFAPVSLPSKYYPLDISYATMDFNSTDTLTHNTQHTTLHLHQIHHPGILSTITNCLTDIKHRMDKHFLKLRSEVIITESKTLLPFFQDFSLCFNGHNTSNSTPLPQPTKH